MALLFFTTVDLDLKQTDRISRKVHNKWNKCGLYSNANMECSVQELFFTPDLFAIFTAINLDFKQTDRISREVHIEWNNRNGLFFYQII